MFLKVGEVCGWLGEVSIDHMMGLYYEKTRE